MEDLNKLYTFVRVAERRSFSKAAADLHISPSSVCKQIAEFETRVGAQLFNRSTRQVSLTEAGTALYEECVMLINGLDRAITMAADIHGSVGGKLRVCCVSGYAQAVIAPLLPDFLEKYPGIKVELISVGLGLSLASEGLDIVIRSKFIPDPGLSYREIGPVKYVICVSRDYIRLHGEPKAPKDLTACNCLTHTLFAPAEWRFSSPHRDIIVRVKGSLQSNNTMILLDAALNGLGVVRLPEYVAKPYLAQGRLRELFSGRVKAQQIMRIYYSSADRPAAKVQHFLDFLDERIGLLAPR